MSRLTFPTAESFNDDNDPDSSKAAPWIKVNVLAETMFCPRAGLLAFQLNEEDNGRERDARRSPRWDYLADYDEREINEQLAHCWQEVWTACNILIGLALICLAFGFGYEWNLAAFLSVAPLYVVWWIFQRFPPIAELHRRRKAAAKVKAEDTLSIADLGQNEETVNYWQLKKHVCMGRPDAPSEDQDHVVNVYKPVEPHRDPELQLAGMPFRILQYRSCRIPVFLKRRGKHEIHQQNRARIAAYCHLIEKTELAQAPFGILMFAGSYDVVIIPNSDRNAALFHRGLQTAQQTISKAEEGVLPEAAPPTRCTGCHWGCPRVHRPGVTDEHLTAVPGELTPFRGVDGRKYHSVCGDRFEWRPPHTRLKEKSAARI